VRSVLADDARARTADYHDSLVYAIARAAGLPWFIDPVPTVDYRQHENNVMGANIGGASALSRLELIRAKWHRGQAVLHAEVGLRIAAPEVRPGLTRMLELMTSTGLRARLALARRAWWMRRRPRDRLIIGALITLGIW
jgi:rhamnosyltransferase